MDDWTRAVSPTGGSVLDTSPGCNLRFSEGFAAGFSERGMPAAFAGMAWLCARLVHAGTGTNAAGAPDASSGRIQGEFRANLRRSS